MIGGERKGKERDPEEGGAGVLSRSGWPEGRGHSPAHPESDQ